MSKHEKFNFKNLEALRKSIAERGLDIQLREDFRALSAHVAIGPKTAPNAMAVLPIEGCDCQPDGSPSELFERRYLRFASGGAGLLWWEACAIVSEGLANPLQMMLTEQNAKAVALLLAKINQAAADKNGAAHRPIHILQLTHSGRYSRPEGHRTKPIICQHDPLLDSRAGIDETAPLATDAYLESLVEHYVKAARLAQDCGFDGVDIKACHRYLISDLLAARNRPGKYGGSFENRTRLLLEIVREVKKDTEKDFIAAVRLNAYDAHPYPYSFGVKPEIDSAVYDPDEPVRLVKQLVENGVQLLCTSAGNPYSHIPHVVRPFDTEIPGMSIPNEHPLEGAARLFGLTRDIQRAAGTVPVVGSGYSWLRQFAPHVGAANLANGSCGFVGFGRLSFAYPDAPRDILVGGLNPGKTCITCSKCTQIMRAHGRTGCVVRDSMVYAQLFKEAIEDAKKWQDLLKQYRKG